MGDKYLQAALAYAARGWPVFALSRSKKPFRGSHGFHDASTDSRLVEQMWAVHAGANVGLATGKVAVFDADGQAGLDTLKSLGQLPRTLVARTPRGGWHFYYDPAGAEIRSRNAPRAEKGGPGLDIKGHGGFVLLPPSRTDRGEYAWANDAPIAPLPEFLKAYAQSVGAQREYKQQPSLPQHLAQRATRELNALALDDHGMPWSPHEEARLRSALKYVGESIGHEGFLGICFGLHWLKWARPNGTDIGFELLDQWARRFSYYNPAGLEKNWASLDRKTNYHGAKYTIGTIIRLAQQGGWDGSIDVDPAPSEQIVALSQQNLIPDTSQVNGHVMALPAELTAAPIVFPDTDKAGRPRATVANTTVAIQGLGIDCRQDIFHERLIVGGHEIAQWAGDLSDNAVLMLRRVIYDRFGFDPGERHARDGAMQLCLQKAFNPITDYLDGLKWDRIPRIATWLSRYMGAEDIEINREFGRLMLLAAVRRARIPGCKFDQIVVLEGPQGAGKSSAIRILAGDDNFSDQSILAASDREQQEAFRGVWIHEIAELAGIRRTDVERIKQFARRTQDRARPAYGRMRQDMKRRGIFVATTNEDDYLKEYDRAFWPVRVGMIDLEGLARDRDQLWAEAAFCEARGDTLALDRKWYAIASITQAERHEDDAWQTLVIDIIGEAKEVSIYEILTGNKFRLMPNEVNLAAQKRIGRILKKLGFVRFQTREGLKRVWKYRLMA